MWGGVKVLIRISIPASRALHCRPPNDHAVVATEDLPREELLEYRPERREPSDFDELRATTLDEAGQHVLEVTFGPFRLADPGRTPTSTTDVPGVPLAVAVASRPASSLRSPAATVVFTPPITPTSGQEFTAPPGRLQSCDAPPR